MRNPLTRFPRSLALVLLAVMCLDLGARAQERPSPKLTFDELARSFIDRHCKKGAPVTECSFDVVLEKSYARFDLGLFAVVYPVEFLEDKGKCEALRSVLLGLVDLEQRWLDWIEPVPPADDTLRKDLSSMRGWIKGWKAGAFANLERAADKDWLVALKPDAAIGDAVRRAQATLLSSERFAIVPTDGKAARVLLCPTRRDFMELLSYGGLVDADARARNWWSISADWTQFWIDRTVCIALEYTPWEGSDPEFRTGLAMTKLSSTGMVQHVSQQAALALLRQCAPTVPESTLDRALAAALTLQVCGEFTTIDNAGSVSTSGARTAPYERFVPGGNPKGGTLPAIKADSQNAIVENHWRKGGGKDRFLAPLREGQKLGAKEAKGKDPLANFVLVGDGGKHVVYAPFFGPHAGEQEYPPPAFVIDYAEFFRSYRTSFVCWLADHGDTTPAAAKEKFSKLVRALSTCTLERSFEVVVSEVYGVPISGKDGTTDSLEWRFLKWIQSGK
ncbi:MAG: hypothetical protein HZA52_09005 [Planctomycetes bacterium]|nr:hypothetical protein [Planctomycetota bacterium]